MKTTDSLPTPRRRLINPDAKTRNITVNADVQEALVAVQTRLVKKFGFEPNLSQTIRHLIHVANEQDGV